MTSTSSSHPSLVESALPLSGNSAILRDVLLVVFGTLLLTLSAKVKVPFWPVPMTMQTFAVIFLAATLGMKLGIATVVLYLAEGAFGLPVFTGTPEKGIGIAYMAGPTGGYLVGFAIAAAITGWAADKGYGRNWLAMLVFMTASMLVIYALGFAWLQNLIGMEKAFKFGVLPFLIGDGVKILLAVALTALGWHALDRRRSED